MYVRNGKKNKKTIQTIKNLTSSNIEKKLAAKLYRLGTQYGLKENEIEDYTYINLNLTVTYIAKMLGYQRETVSRSLKLISTKGNNIAKDRKFYVNIEKAREFFKK